MNILILNAHWNNRGDEAAIRAMIDSIREKMEVDKMSIMLLSNDRRFFPYHDIELVDPFPTYTQGRIVSKLLFLGDSLAMLLSGGRYALTKQGREYLRTLDGTDFVIHAPGGPSIGDLYSGPFGIFELTYLIRLWISIIKNKPVFFYAPSMGPFTGVRNILRKYVLRKSIGIIVREEISQKNLSEQLGLNAIVTIDSALQNEVHESDLQNIEQIGEIISKLTNKKVIGMTITDLRWHPIYKTNANLQERIRTEITHTIDYLTDNGYEILLIPQLFGSQDDMTLLEYFKEKARNNGEVSILPQFIDAYGQQYIISHLYCVIGMRYHPTIFAAKGRVPAIAISYEHKTKGFMDKLGRLDSLIPVEDIDSERIIEKFKYIEENYDFIRDHLFNRVPKLIEISQKTTEILIKTQLGETHERGAVKD